MTATPLLDSIEYLVLEAVAETCDTYEEGYALASAVGDEDAVLVLVARGYVDPHACNTQGMRVLSVTEAGWAVLAEAGYCPPWDRAVDDYYGDPESFGEGVAL